MATGYQLATTLLPQGFALVYVQVDGRSELSGTRMMIAAAACGLLAIGFYLLCYYGVEERVRTAPKPRE